MIGTPVRTILAFAVVAATAAACSCIGQSDAKYRAQADVVFAGTVTDRTDAAPGPNFSSVDPIAWTFAVEATAKGGDASTRMIVSSRDGASCGFTFTVGSRYVVFARRDGARLTTSICSGTRELTPGESPFALRRVAVFGTYGTHVSRAVLMTRTGEHPGRGALRLLLDDQFRATTRLASQIPAGTRLRRYAAADGTVTVVLSRRFAATPTAKLRLALAQVVFTVADMPGVRHVRVRTELGQVPGFDRLLTVKDFAAQA